MNKYFYDPGEHRRKHCGSLPEAHFDEQGSTKIGKCPSSLSKNEAQELLQGGVPYYDNPEDEHPARIYAIYEGVIYEAFPTRPGISYHGFPWRGRPKHNRLPRPIKRELEQRAREQGCLDKFQSWLEQYEC